MKRLFSASLVGLLFALSAAATQAQINFGAVGDSLTDEYLPAPNQFSTDLAAYSWLEIIARLRSGDFNFGEYREAPNYWGDRRDAGYEFNWAKVGAVASDNTALKVNFGGSILPLRLDNPLLGGSYISTQTAGLAAQIANDQVQVAFVGGGSNDFFYRTTLFDPSQNRYPDPAAAPAGDVVDIASAILANLDTLIAAGASSSRGSVDLVLGLLPAGTASDEPPSQELLDAIAAVNDLLVAGASQRGVATVDMWSWTLDDGRLNPDGSVNIGDLIVEPDSVASAADLSLTGSGACNASGLCATSTHATKLLAEDGTHPNTAIQGLMANQILAALNASYGYNVALLSDAEIVSLTGYTAVPVPAALWLFGSALLALAGIRRKALRPACV
ncbi:MAG TPA: SGNH/GDSL hydrolase family protein [Spongiibacteraceae bacterium]|jgi:lysophospholipase L1-like esterase|nr:GDSL-type esterase/lipase family protein [Spongiibacteraceae bacterium]HUH36606.1 SGNH/GDSL hydrolase family protein [Spongiibacteraceae bacterium]